MRYSLSAEALHLCITPVYMAKMAAPYRSNLQTVNHRAPATNPRNVYRSITNALAAEYA